MNWTSPALLLHDAHVTTTPASGRVTAVCASPSYTMAKPSREQIELVAGLGVAGDVHSGVTVKHRSRVKRDPTQPNLRQVHLIHSELHDELRAGGFEVAAGRLGENVTTQGVDLLALPTGTLLGLGDVAVVRVTGLRNPCLQIDGVSSGLLKAVLGRDDEGGLIRKAGVMAVVMTSGLVRPGDVITVTVPHEPHVALQPV